VTREHVLAAVCCAVAAAALGWLGPRLLARLPEPDEPAEDKPRYAVLAGTRGLAGWVAALAALVAGSIGAVLGPDWSLPAWVYLSAVGVLLGFVDWRTKLLPYRIVAPSYAVVGLLLVLATAMTRDISAGTRALIAWVATFAAFFLLNLIHPAGMGYGDVRLSGLLAMALGWLGWAELVVGLYAGFLLGAVVGGVLALARVVDRKSYPFGPFMLAGAWVGVLAAPLTASWWA